MAANSNDVPVVAWSDVEQAAQWLAEQDEGAIARPLTAELRDRFGLAFNDACRAIAESRRLRK